MRLTVLGGVGAWPTATAAASGYLVSCDGFTVLVDPGYASFPALQAVLSVADVDAVLVTHGHPDHCADLNPLLRARALGDDLPPLPLYAPDGALDRVLALDQVTLTSAYTLHAFDGPVELGPFRVDTFDLPHFVPNAGIRLATDRHVLAYTGDTGPSPAIVELARDADVFLAEATFADRVRPADNAPFLSTARQAGEYASAADVGRLVLTHLWPESSPDAALEAARVAYRGPLDVAVPGLLVDLTAGEHDADEQAADLTT